MDTQALPNLKELFRVEGLGVAAVHVLGEKNIIHSEIFGEVSKSKLARVQEANTLIDEAFRERGITKLYTWAETDEQYRYNMFLGYKPNGKEVVLDNDYPNTIYEFEKDL